MAKSYYSHKKREKETIRKLKKDQKRQRKLDKSKLTSVDSSARSHDEAENPQAERDESVVTVSNGEK